MNKKIEVRKKEYKNLAVTENLDKYWGETQKMTWDEIVESYQNVKKQKNMTDKFFEDYKKLFPTSRKLIRETRNRLFDNLEVLEEKVGIFIYGALIERKNCYDLIFYRILETEGLDLRHIISVEKKDLLNVKRFFQSFKDFETLKAGDEQSEKIKNFYKARGNKYIGIEEEDEKDE